MSLRVMVRKPGGATGTPHPPDEVNAANLTGWWRADSGLWKTTARLPGDEALATNDPVAAWDNRVAALPDVEQSLGGARPILKLNQLGGQPTLLFDGADDRFLGPSFSTYITHDNYTVYAVWKATVVDTNAPDLWLNDGVYGDLGGYMGQYLRSPGGPSGTVHAYNYTDGVAQVSRPFNLGTWYITRQRHVTPGPPPGTLYLRRSGLAEEASIAANTTAGANIFAINLGAGFGSSLGGEIAELIFYKTDLTPTDQGSIEAYLQGRYNVIW